MEIPFNSIFPIWQAIDFLHCSDFNTFILKYFILFSKISLALSLVQDVWSVNHLRQNIDIKNLLSPNNHVCTVFWSTFQT